MRTGLRSKLVLGCPLASVLGTCRVHPTSDPQLHQRLSPTQSKAAGCQHFFFFKYQRNDYNLSQILGAKRAARHLHEGLGGSGTVFGQLWLSF